MKYLSLLFFIFLVSAFLMPIADAFGQFEVRGQVLDAQNDAPLQGVTIQVAGSQIGTVSQSDGSFSLNFEDSEKREFVFRFIGYQTQRLTLRPGEKKIHEIKLIESTQELRSIAIESKLPYPVTQTQVSREELQKLNLGQDIPFLLRFTPSVVTTSDAGAGVGYTGMRIRGSDPTRTNVTINGIPLNDAESQGVFWVNMPDFASSVGSINIQRGAGTSVNGAGAFGATVGIDTEVASEEAYAEIDNSFGSFNTRRHSLRVGTGRIANHFKIDARLSQIKSDGFIDRAFSDMRSFYLSGVYDKGKTNITLNIFSGQEQTFQAWYGVPEEQLRQGNRNFNPVAAYDNETDNYQQDHYQLIWNQQLDDKGFWNLKTALHYTKGRGYFEQYRENDRLSRYGFEPVQIGDSTISRSDLVRRRWLDNDFYGMVYYLTYNDKDRWNMEFGGGANRYEGKHFGEVIWARSMPQADIRHRYYDNDAFKTDLNTFVKANYRLFDQLYVFGDLQLRSVNYDFLGFDENLVNVQQNDALLFFNPKFGLSYELGVHNFYASYARASREPNRNDYTQSTPDSRPRAEKMDNIEVGWEAAWNNKWSVFANGYLMNYIDQLILTGEVNDVGAYIRQNIERSYRYGLELGVRYDVEKFSWQGNASLSRNIIPEFVEFLDDFDTGEQVSRTYQNTQIAFSPALIANSIIEYKPIKGLSVGLYSQYIGRQYLDNTETLARSLDPYFVNDIRLAYDIQPKNWVRNIRFTLLINNVLNEEYESNGYTFGYIAGGAQTYENFYYPQAGTNFLAGVLFRL